MFSHTKIYSRYDLHLGVLLTMCSPLWIDFPGDGRIRGWISTVIIGDSGTGKSTVSEVLFNLAGVGYRVSGMTSSRTGITYACEFDERRGWRIKAGALLKMSGQALIVDEAQDLAEADLKTMAEALDRGRLKIDRIQNKEFMAETRCCFICNPINPKRSADQRTMGSYRYGCMSVADIFPKMMLRRLDIVLFAAAYDIKNKNEIFNSITPAGFKRVVTAENLRALVHYAWNLKPEQIVISERIADLIKMEAANLSGKFGACEDLPIVYPEDFRKTFARHCVAAAVVDLSSDDDFETITVKEKHVHFMADQLEDNYSHKNCQLNKHSAWYAKENNIVFGQEQMLFDRFKKHIEDGIDADGKYARKERLTIVLNELVRLEPDNQRYKLAQSYLKEILDCGRSTVFRDLKPLIHERLISSSRGYLPTPKLFQFLHWIEENYPGYLELDQ